MFAALHSMSLHLARRVAPGWLIAAAAAAATLPTPHAARAADGATDFSAAERALFMEDQFGSLKPPTTLHYAFRKFGSLEPGFEDSVTVSLKAQPNGACCAALGEFLSGDRRMPMPDVEAAAGNPVTMYFLERDVREMQRLTKGQQNHFRKQIRMAIYDAATLRDVSLPFRGKPVAGREIVISPYLTDPNRPRFEKFANKQYVFLLSSAVPGGVYAIRTRVADVSGAADAPPLLSEEMLIEGGEPAAGASKR